MAQVNAYLLFSGNCKEAMNFYKAALGGELQLMSFAESPMESQTPPDSKNKIMHARLKNGAIDLMGSDLVGPGTVTKGNSISLSLACGSKQEADTLFGKLSAGGKVAHPMKEEFFGYYGDFADKYGFNWMLIHETPRK